MSANEVTEKILAEANEQAGKIKAGAEHKASELLRQTDRELEEFNEETRRLRKRAFEEAESRILAAARMEQARKRLKIKREILDTVFAKAGETIKNMSRDDYTTLMEGLLRSCLETGEEEVVIAKNDSRLGADFLEAVNAGLGSRGKLTMAAEKADIEAGFILLRGSLRVNASLNVLIAQARESLEIDIAKELFSSN